MSGNSMSEKANAQNGREKLPLHQRGLAFPKIVRIRPMGGAFRIPTVSEMLFPFAPLIVPGGKEGFTHQK